MIETYKNKYLSGISMFLHKTFRTGLDFLSQSKWVQIVVCYDRNLQKHKYLSWISIFLYETFRTGLVFLSQLKWVQIVVCYMWNLQKCKYFSELPFWANLTHFFWQNLALWVIFSQFGVKAIGKVKKLKELWGKTYKMTKIGHFEPI